MEGFEINLFSLHGKWYENDENRLTSNLLFFLSYFKEELLMSFIQKFIDPEIKIGKGEIKTARIEFQTYESGVIPDAQIIIGEHKKILIEAKIQPNSIGYNQLKEYSERLSRSKENFPDHFLLVITQTDQKSSCEKYAKKISEEGYLDFWRLKYAKWYQIIDFLKNSAEKSKDLVLKNLIEMFLMEVENTLYNRIDIDELPVGKLNEVVFTSQEPKFQKMALEDHVIWPFRAFRPALYVACYFNQKCKDYGGTISHFARLKHLWYNVTIDEVISSLPELKGLPDFDRFIERAKEIYTPGSEKQFCLGMTEKPIKLNNPIPFKEKEGHRFRPNIIPSKRSTLDRLLSAKELDDLYIN